MRHLLQKENKDVFSYRLRGGKGLKGSIISRVLSQEMGNNPQAQCGKQVPGVELEVLSQVRFVFIVGAGDY